MPPDTFPTMLADAGIPMIVLTLPAMLLLLIPVIVVEALLCRKWLGWSVGKAIRLNAASNSASTLVGVPIAWGIMLLIEMGAGALLVSTKAFESVEDPGPFAKAVYLLIASAWIGSPEGGGIWMIPAATLVLLVPFYFASYWTEYFVIKAMLGSLKNGGLSFEPQRTKTAIRNANLVTYAAMFLATSVWLVVELTRHQRS